MTLFSVPFVTPSRPSCNPKLFEFSQKTKREELKIKNEDTFCSCFVPIAPLQWFSYNGLTEIVSTSLICFYLQAKLPYFMATGYIGKYRLVVKNFKANENAALAVRSFS